MRIDVTFTPEPGEDGYGAYSNTLTAEGVQDYKLNVPAAGGLSLSVEGPQAAWQLPQAKAA